MSKNAKKYTSIFVLAFVIAAISQYFIWLSDKEMNHFPRLYAATY